MPTKIQWCDEVWNPVTGCTPAGVGCHHCYAAAMAKRFWGDRPFSDVQCHPYRLGDPTKWKMPRSVFVNSMSDLFHEAVPFTFVAQVYEVMERRCPQHTFIVLTKRPERLRAFEGICEEPPLQNLVIGVSCSTQAEVNRMVPVLLDVPAHRRIVSLEPLVESVYLPCDLLLHGVIVGGESGPGARPMHPDWARSLRDQCAAAGVPFYFKQWGEFCGACQLPESADNLDLSKSVLLNILGETGLPYPGDSDGEDRVRLYHVGTKRAGRTLDGRTHDALCWEVRKHDV